MEFRIMYKTRQIETEGNNKECYMIFLLFSNHMQEINIKPTTTRHHKDSATM